MNQKVELLEKSEAKFITLKQAKKYLRVDNTYDDEIISDMIDTCCVAAENYLGRSLQESKWKVTVYGNLSSSIKLFHAPISRVEYFKLYQHDGEVIYLNSKHYILDRYYENIHMRRGYIAEKSEIHYYIGYAADRLPTPIKQAMLEHLSRLYDLRGSDKSLPLAAKDLYQPYKRMRF